MSCRLENNINDMKNEKNIFVVFNTTSIGDVLVTNTLVRNIKYYYPQSYVVFVCNSPLQDVAKYQDGVDDVVPCDKDLIKSLKGISDFAFKFPYKKPFASFITYSNERNLLISRLIGSKHVISHHKFPLWNTKEKYQLKNYLHMKDRWGGMVEALTGEHKNFAIKYIPPEINTPVIQKIKDLNRPVPISATSNFQRKDMKVNDCIELIDSLKKKGFTPVMTGAGEVARKFNIELKKAGCFDFIDIVDCTSFVEFAQIMKTCKGCISVDTGTMHFANALQVPVVGVFYDGLVNMWGSDSTLYPSIMLEGRDVKPQDIMTAFGRLCGVSI